jgi:hypothetical protein
MRGHPDSTIGAVRVATKSERKRKHRTMRILVIGDTHCGSSTGLTPPSFDSTPPEESFDKDIYQLRRWLWARFDDEIARFLPFDVAIWNGDLIEGSQYKEAGAGLLGDMHDPQDQVRMANQIVKKVGATHNRFTYGTAYHVESFERTIADEFGSSISKELLETFDGVTIHAMHHIGGSANSMNRTSGLVTEATKLMHRLYGTGNTVDILVRNHRHLSAQANNNGIDCFSVPALQLPTRSQYGRKFSGKLGFGFLVIDTNAGAYTAKIVDWSLDPVVESTLDKAIEQKHRQLLEDLPHVKAPPKQPPVLL